VIPRPQDRDLERPELEQVVLELASRRDLWAHLVAHDPEARVYEELLRDNHLAVWLICWMDDQDTGFHDHDRSAGAVAVVDGSVIEDRLLLGRPPASRRFGAGAAFSFAASDIHRVRHGGGGPAVSIHAYSPPLWRMGTYEVRPDGELARHSVSYAEELRPLVAG
jgi:predicted metal-dependent enzyme (double-stranded beta helix superfamily)